MGGAADALPILYSDNFDTNTSANYTVNQDADTTVEYAWDYSAMGIPSAPNSSGGSTLGVKFTANNGDATAAAAAINISPTGQSFSGDYILKFDVWMNANGPFPGGGTGSTEFFTAGVANNGAGVQKSSGTANGPWFAVDGEGQSGIDYRAYQATALATPTNPAYGVYAAGTAADARSAANTYYHGTFPGGQTPPTFQQVNYPQQTGALAAGTIGFAWREVVVKKLGTNVSFTIDDLPIATFQNPASGGSNVFIGYWDVFSSISDNPALSFGVFDNLVVEQIPEPSTAVMAALVGLGLAARRRR